jgi:sigma-B regulation protein RsbU (phosphoserine phosphatase)
VVGDVSGKGVPAALMMAVCKTLIKSKASTDKSTASIMTQVNSEMAHENTNYMFVTVFIGILNTQTGELTYTNAGHNPTYIKKRNGSLEKLTTLHGPVIAAMEGLSYKESIVNVNSGDSIFAYTDGIPEAHNVQNELYGNETLDTFILNNPFISPQKMIENVIEDVHTFEGEAEKFDDLTALCIQYHGTENGAVQRDIVTINNKIAEVQIVIEKFEAFSSALNLPVEIAMKMSIVFDELLANVIKYAYTDDKEHLIYVEFKLAENKLILIIEDKGIPFNPFQKEPPDTMLSVQERAVGGLGIHIVKNLMDEYHYTRTTNKNILTLIKYNVLN